MYLVEEEESDDEREEVNNLYKEATMPLAEIMEQYSRHKNDVSFYKES